VVTGLKAGTLYKKHLGRSLRGLRIIESIEVTLRKIREAVRQKSFSDVGMRMYLCVGTCTNCLHFEGLEKHTPGQQPCLK